MASYLGGAALAKDDLSDRQTGAPGLHAGLSHQHARQRGLARAADLPGVCSRAKPRAMSD